MVASRFSWHPGGGDVYHTFRKATSKAGAHGLFFPNARQDPRCKAIGGISADSEAHGLGTAAQLSTILPRRSSADRMPRGCKSRLAKELELLLDSFCGTITTEMDRPVAGGRFRTGRTPESRGQLAM